MQRSRLANQRKSWPKRTYQMLETKTHNLSLSTQLLIILGCAGVLHYTPELKAFLAPWISF